MAWLGNLMRLDPDKPARIALRDVLTRDLLFSLQGKWLDAVKFANILSKESKWSKVCIFNSHIIFNKCNDYQLILCKI